MRLTYQILPFGSSTPGAAGQDTTQEINLGELRAWRITFRWGTSTGDAQTRPVAFIIDGIPSSLLDWNVDGNPGGFASFSIPSQGFTVGGAVVNGEPVIMDQIVRIRIVDQRLCAYLFAVVETIDTGTP